LSAVTDAIKGFNPLQSIFYIRFQGRFFS